MGLRRVSEGLRELDREKRPQGGLGEKKWSKGGQGKVHVRTDEIGMAQ